MFLERLHGVRTQRNRPQCPLSLRCLKLALKHRFPNRERPDLQIERRPPQRQQLADPQGSRCPRCTSTRTRRIPSRSSKSWKPAEGKARCPHARPGVIVLGEGQGTFLQVCIAKKECQKHWGRAKVDGIASAGRGRRAGRRATKAGGGLGEATRDMGDQPSLAARSATSRTALGRSSFRQRSASLLRLLLEDIRPDDLFVELVG
jgi:hypothetical protein